MLELFTMRPFALLFLLFLASCGPKPSQKSETAVSLEGTGGLVLPEGFVAEVFADELGEARHLTVAEDGTVYVRLRRSTQGKSMVALRDTNHDGKADIIERFGPSEGGTGIAVRPGYLYFSTDSRVYRQRRLAQCLLPEGKPELLIELPEQDQHAAKPLAFDQEGHLYLTIGAPSNSCQEPDRQRGVAGQDPCPLLDYSGGIWRFSASTPNQQFEDGLHYASGIRHAVGISWNDEDARLYAMQHGRDQLHEHWPEYYNLRQSAALPAEEFFRVDSGDHFGWPYCYYDWQKDQKLLNPEYGGNGDSIGRCRQFEKPIVAFPGHWAPNALQFYHAEQFPVSYKGGAFIAFHGSWNRAPFPQQGYKVVFVPFSGGEPMGGYSTFADGFAGEDEPEAPSDAQYRPCGLAVGPEGYLYISDSRKGRIWQVRFAGEKPLLE